MSLWTFVLLTMFKNDDNVKFAMTNLWFLWENLSSISPWTSSKDPSKQVAELTSLCGM